jgi:hypothetical protein
MTTLKSHQIQAMLEDLDLINGSLRDIERRDAHAHFITELARAKLHTIKSTLLRASLSDVEVVSPVVRKTVPMVPARQAESV